jgi:uncharacterized membrane protein (UPF0127 family)
MKMRITFAILLVALLLGCSNPSSVSSNPNSTPVSQEETPKNQGQMLPIEAKVKLGNEIIELEVAKTEQQQQIGLMYRTNMPKNRGMIFLFDPPRYTRFWMKNVSIPLDMIFLKNGKIAAIFADVPPCNSTPCATYGPDKEIDRVIELGGGRAQELGLKVGDLVNVTFLDTP